jgi:deoxyadenosine/deoxycytidine kinase
MAPAPSSSVLGRAFVVCVEGNIASGKTSLVHLFQKYANVKAFEEPVKRWRCVKGADGTHNLLQLLYEDPKRWSFAFQHYVQLTMLQ